MLNASNAINSTVLLSYQSAGDGTVQPVVVGCITISPPYQIVYVDGTTKAISGACGSASHETNSICGG